MKVEELERKVSLLEVAKDYFPALKKVGTDTYDISPCPVCNHRGHLRINARENYYNSFSGCCEGGSVYKFLIEVVGLREDEAYEKLLEYANIRKDKRKINVKKQQNFTELILKNFEAQTEQDKQVFRDMGFSDALIEEYKLVVLTLDTKRAVFPYWLNGEVVSYNARSLHNEEPKYKKPSGSANFIFNEGYLKEKEQSFLFICEGEKDALSIEEIGYKAIGLGSAKNVSKLFEKIEEYNAFEHVYIACFDNDEAGKEATEKFVQFAKEKNLLYAVFEFDYKDVHEFLIHDRKRLQQSIEEFLRTIEDDIKTQQEERINNELGNDLEKFLLHEYANMLARYKIASKRKTGFSKLDEKIVFGTGLYILGGVPALGKTTFALQLATQLAEQNEHVLFFTLEQSKFTLTNKILSLLTARDFTKAGFVYDTHKAISVELLLNFEKQTEEQTKRINEAFEKLQSFASNFQILEGRYALTVERIEDYVKKYIAYKKVRPIVFVDYLQILDVEATNSKERIDKAVTMLKQISVNYDVCIVAISSFNRASYNEEVNYTSFKETGGIEYTADVLLGFQLKTNKQEFEELKKEGKIENETEYIRNLLSRNPRSLELVCLKNREGEANFVIDFLFYPAHNLFIEF